MSPYKVNKTFAEINEKTIYNKVQEVIDKGRPLLHRGTGTGEDPPIVTRVERQCTGISVPLDLRTLGAFFKNIANFDPFKNVVLIKGGTPPNTGLCTAQRWLMNLGVQAAVCQYGWMGARREADRRSTRNNILDRYLELTGALHPGLTKPQLTATYIGKP